MAVIGFKFTSALAIFVMAFLAGVLPWSFARINKKFFALGDAFADGIFISIALFHMLPQAAKRFESVDLHYPFAYLFCLLTFVILVLLERGLSISLHTSHDNGAERHNRKIGPNLLIAVLSIHSVLAGAALGVEYSSVGAAIIFLAILAHKGAASFALGHYIQRFNISFARHVSYILLFSLMTPLGILGGTLIISQVPLHAEQYLSPTFLALAAGTFLYIGSVHIFERPYFKSSVNYLSSYFSMLAGIGLMAVVAIWL